MRVLNWGLGLAIVYLGFGSNLGDRKANVREAIERLDAIRDTSVKHVSSLYESAPVGYTDQPGFINSVAEIQTDLSPRELLSAVLGIESDMGRVRNTHWGPRVIDIDILVYDAIRMETPELTIPHPRMAERRFVLDPLVEIAPGLILPDGRRIEEALPAVCDQKVFRVSDDKL